MISKKKSINYYKQIHKVMNFGIHIHHKIMKMNIQVLDLHVMHIESDDVILDLNTNPSGLPLGAVLYRI